MPWWFIDNEVGRPFWIRVTLKLLPHFERTIPVLHLNLQSNYCSDRNTTSHISWRLNPPRLTFLSSTPFVSSTLMLILVIVTISISLGPLAVLWWMKDKYGHTGHTLTPIGYRGLRAMSYKVTLVRWWAPVRELRAQFVFFGARAPPPRGTRAPIPHCERLPCSQWQLKTNKPSTAVLLHLPTSHFLPFYGTET